MCAASASKRRAVVVRRHIHSPAVSMPSFHQYVLWIGPTTCRQAASRASTAASTRARASSSVPIVVVTWRNWLAMAPPIAGPCNRVLIPTPRRSPRAAAHHADDLDDVAVVQRAPRVGVAGQDLAVHLDGDGPRVDPQPGDVVQQRRRAGKLDGAAVDAEANHTPAMAFQGGPGPL